MQFNRTVPVGIYILFRLLGLYRRLDGSSLIGRHKSLAGDEVEYLAAGLLVEKFEGILQEVGRILLAELSAAVDLKKILNRHAFKIH